MKDKEKTKSIAIAGAISLLIVMITSTFAYFIATGGTPKDMDITVTTNTVDNLEFQVGDAINIFASPSNFGNGQGDQTGSSYARAVLTPNNKTNTATAHYYLYLNITKNELEYTTASHKAELMLTVTDGENNIVPITGLPEVKDGENNVIGYDITEEEGLITILNNHEIVANGAKTENWNVTVTFINLPDKQNDNAGKLFTAKVMIQEKEYEEPVGESAIAAFIVNEFQSNTSNTNGLYHHDGTIKDVDNVTVLDAEDGSYRYAGANPNNYVCFGYDDPTHTYGNNWCPEDNLYRIIGLIDNKVKLIKGYYANSTLLGNNGAFAEDINLTTVGLDTSYKGTLTSHSSYYWNTDTDNNVWSESNLNTVNLNTNYLNNIGSDWAAKIAPVTWYVGGTTADNGIYSNAKTAYNYELGNNKQNVTVNSKIGLMYMSEYYYAAIPTYWSLPGKDTGPTQNDYRVARDYNWMYLGCPDWMISPVNDMPEYAFLIRYGMANYEGLVEWGRVSPQEGSYDMAFIRPTFYLNSTVEIIDGSGTSADPYRIN